MGRLKWMGVLMGALLSAALLLLYCLQRLCRFAVLQFF